MISIHICFLCSLTLKGDILTEENNNPTTKHIFHNPDFWHHFETQVRSKFIYGNFAPYLLLKTFEKDKALYDDNSIFRKRRLNGIEFVKNDSLWIDIVLGACKEYANGVRGPYSKKLQDTHILDAFEDYVAHLDYFQQVASVMASKGEEVHVFSQNSSEVHDIDKLDPAMLVGYSERFEDQRETSVWNVCVERHTKVNPHHQAHCLWHDCCQILKSGNSCRSSGSDNSCENARNKALREMVCDKVSRRLQKNLGGQMSNDMWNVEAEYFKGIPEVWVDKAVQLMQSMKESSLSNHRLE